MYFFIYYTAYHTTYICSIRLRQVIRNRPSNEYKIIQNFGMNVAFIKLKVDFIQRKDMKNVKNTAKCGVLPPQSPGYVL